MKRKPTRGLVTCVQQMLFSQEIPTIELQLRSKQRNADLPQVNDSIAMYKLARDQWDPLKMNLCEEFKVCLMNNANRVLGIFNAGTGGVRNCYIDPRMIIAAALLSNATSIILLHNHPSGQNTPSQADIALTRQIKAAAELFNICVADHIIISDSGGYSFGAEGLL